MNRLEQSIERSPENLAVIRQLLQLYRNGLEQPDTIGYHGCSLETVEYTIQHSNIPGATIVDAMTPAGALFFSNLSPEIISKIPSESKYYFLIQEAQQNHRPTVRLTHYEAQEQSKFFARHQALTRRFMSIVGLTQNDREDVTLASDIMRGELIEGTKLYAQSARRDLRTRSISDSKLDDAIKQSLHRKGILLGVSRKIAEDFSVNQSHNLKDVFVVSDHGYTLDYFTGLRCEGPEEEAFFQDLETRYGHLLDENK